MKKYYSIHFLLSTGLLCSSNILLANQKPETPIPSDSVITAQALTNMSDYLRSLDKFTVHSQINVDDVLPSGQKIQLSRSVTIKAEPPSSLWAKTSTMHNEREFFFDGKTFTIYTPKLGFYASFDAPGTIGETLNKAKQEFNVEMPLRDLFHWESDGAETIDEAMIIGVDKVNGISCNLFAIRQQEIDWQICIQRDDTPLPLKLVITSKKEESQPQYTAVLQWDTKPTLSKQSYTFAPSETDHKINFSKSDTNK